MATSITQPIVLAAGEHTFQANKITFGYKVAGNGPLLVAQVPGWGPGSSYMTSNWNTLSEHFTVIYFNPRGNPGSSRPVPESDMSTDFMASDLEALRLHLNVPSFMAIGHSNGGSIALGYAERFPNRVSKLVLIDHDLKGFKDPTGAWDRFAEARKDNPLYRPALEKFRAIVTGAFPITSDKEFGSALVDIIPYYMADPRKAHLFVESMDYNNPPSIWAFGSQMQADATVLSQVESLSEVKAQTLVIWGKEDAICPVSIGERTVEGISGARIVAYENCGHFPWIEKKGEFFEEVIGFLKS